MKHLDLFSGIGGFALAVDTVWPDSEHIFCDNDKFCQAVLKKHWPKSKIYGDIREFITDTESIKQRELAMERQQNKKTTVFGSGDTILTAGFPCQPFSQAGRRKGTSDNRYLWPEMLRIIQNFKPKWVIAENVRGLVTWNEGLVLEQVRSDLESAGYEVQPFIIPAVAKNAPHRRDRIWFVAYKFGERLEGESSITELQKSAKVIRHTRHASNSPECGWTKGNKNPTGANKREAKKKKWNGFADWNRPWLEVAAELCRVDDGLSVRLDGFKLSKAGHRTARLKALGNAIVPQVAIEIMKAIKESYGNK